MKQHLAFRNTGKSMEQSKIETCVDTEEWKPVVGKKMLSRDSP